MPIVCSAEAIKVSSRREPLRPDPMIPDLRIELEIMVSPITFSHKAPEGQASALLFVRCFTMLRIDKQPVKPV